MILRTERLVLRPFREDDVEAFERFADAEAYRRHLGDAHPRPAQFVTNNLGADGSWVIEVDGTVVGSAFLGDELAILLDPAVHAQGIGTEAATAVIADGFERRGYDQIMARADAANSASIHTLIRLGFVDRADGTRRLDRQSWSPRGAS